ncbi:competence protein ComK [Bacillus benzoevorans]|uniref:Competence protein ComK n=1 Tax=Bacillus benzoevorans TaxID=1456 RepID=A0A7X0HTW6_9BACI|nr:competence protein ComK [Bacillus benzoevorans]MBB6446748.1 competence protein ComK [Bacillus benzoevorans]
MHKRNDYLFNCNTVALFSNFHLGNEYSGVLQGKKHFFVRQSPLTIVQTSFQHVGSSLEGALRSSRFHLNKKCNVPVALSARNNVILIQCKAAGNLGGTVWIAASHIVRIEPYKINQTIVYTTEGHELIVDMKTAKLQNIRKEAPFLRAALLKSQTMQNGLINDDEENSGFLLVKENGQLNYTTKQKGIVKK